jgi:hypothetical protein
MRLTRSLRVDAPRSSPIALTVLVLAACGGGDPAPKPAPEPERTPFPTKRLPVGEAAEYLRLALDECLGREGLIPSLWGGSAPILDEAGARTPGSVAIHAPYPVRLLYVVFTPKEARAVVRSTRTFRLTARGRVLYEPSGIARPDVRARVDACIDEAEAAAPAAG